MTASPHSPDDASRRETRTLLPIVVGWLLVACFVGIAIGFDRSAHVRVFQAGWLVGFAGMALVLRAIWQLPETRVPGSWSLWVLGFVLLRFALLPTVPSDDLYRYMWEGKIQRHGFNPFIVAPGDARLAELRDGDPNVAHINHPDYPAIYPPIAQFLFRAVNVFGDSIYLLKVAFVALDVAMLVVLGRLLQALGVSRYRAAVFALCPLTLTAIAIEGHLDALMLFFLATTALLATQQRITWCGVTLGLAIASKLVCIVLLPWFLFRKPRAAFIALGVALLSYLPFADGGWQIFSSLRRFGGTVGGLGVVVRMLEQLVTPPTARIIAAAILAGFALYLSWRRESFDRYATRMLAASVLALPVVHFWYLTWPLAFAWVRLRVSWLLLALLMGLYFEAGAVQYASGDWVLPTWVPSAIYGPFAVMWCVEEWIRRKRNSLQEVEI